MYNIDEYVDLIRERLSDYRFHHSMCVAKSAKELAKRYGADPEKAEVAGVLHDVMKESTKEEQLEVIEKAGMSLTELEKSHKKFYHQVSGAAFAKAELKITDSEILNAIRYHTTGCANMSLMEQIVYLADFISDDRDYDDVDIMRQKVDASREEGMLYATRYTIVSVINKGAILHPDTVDAYNWLIKTYFDKRKG
ncbi:MAG: bis(5'-nucleosyl)-tetraphosphatase (symmetrical) YqeK [Clostridiales bacterium]|nr:bis(5'-nucleosyl)-tetraphosphatase (symmetrical) YqeK [Clostridiales bacterium]